MAVQWMAKRGKGKNTRSLTEVLLVKFKCPMHSEAKQTKTLEFGAEKGLLQGLAVRMSGSCSETLNSLMVFWKKFLFIFLAALTACECS